MPKFQKRHYEAFAQLMQDTAPKDLWDNAQWCAVRDALCAMFKTDNPRFSPGRFRDACMPGANVAARPKRASRVGN